MIEGGAVIVLLLSEWSVIGLSVMVLMSNFLVGDSKKGTILF